MAVAAWEGVAQSPRVPAWASARVSGEETSFSPPLETGAAGWQGPRGGLPFPSCRSLCKGSPWG